ncbi:MAG: LysE family transporter [Candidatus Thiodiazotropha sp. 6PLUC4]
MQEHVISALIFGLTAGLKPGPLALVVIQQSLAHGFRSGLKASLAPLITDGPIILFTLLIMTRMDHYYRLLGVISFIGGVFLLYLAFNTISSKSLINSSVMIKERSLSTAIKINLLSPYPYLFWLTVGGSYIASGSQTAATAFVLISIGTLVASKILLAWIASHFSALLQSQTYFWLIRLLGVLLGIFGIFLIQKGFTSFLAI